MTLKASDWRKVVVDEEYLESTEIGTAIPISRTRSSKTYTPYRLSCDWSPANLKQFPYRKNPQRVLAGEILDRFDSETISYENTRFARFGNCHHTKSSFRTLSTSHVPNEQVCWNKSSDPAQWQAHHVLEGPYGFLPWDGGESPLQLWRNYPSEPQHLDVAWDALDINDLLARAIKEMTPEIESEMSLLVSLAELGDLKDLILAGYKIAQKMQNLVQRGINKKKPLAAILAALSVGQSEFHLTNTFGTRQLLTDVAVVMSVFQRVEPQLRSLIERAGTVQTRHWRLPVEVKRSEYYKSRSLDYNWYGVNQWSTEGTRQFNVTMKYTYELTDSLGNRINLHDTDLLKMGAWLDSLGINMNPEIIWDLIPFSFVVDWFIKVGDWLEGFKVNNLNSSVTILDMCYSIKTQVTSDYLTLRRVSGGTAAPASSSSPLCGMVECRLTSSTYDRVRVTPTAQLLYGNTLPDLGSPAWGKFQIGVSLLTSNLLGSTSRRRAATHRGETRRK